MLVQLHDWIFTWDAGFSTEVFDDFFASSVS